MSHKSPFPVGAIYCGIVAIHFPYIAIYRDTLFEYRDSPSLPPLVPVSFTEGASGNTKSSSYTRGLVVLAN